MSPLHALAISIFDSMRDNFHECALDSLYSLTIFYKEAHNHNFRLICHGVTRKVMRGFPNYIVQNEVKHRTFQMALFRTVETEIL